MCKQIKDLSAVIFVFTLVNTACNVKDDFQLPVDVEVMHKNQRNLTNLIIYDIFSPPVAARIYAYTSLAAHEAIRHADTNEGSIIAKLNGFEEMPFPDMNKKYDFTLAATRSFYDVARQMTFSKDTITKYEEQIYAGYKESLDEETYNNSMSFGSAVAIAVIKRMAGDYYKETRAMDKYFGSDLVGRWKPTSPDYLDGTEPYWTKIRSMTLDSSSQFDPGPPPVYSTDTTSKFFQINKEVYNIGMNLTPEQKDIAYFWDDNPFVSHHTGHLMFNTKKQTPGGHWMGIATIACRMSKADAIKTARTYALVGVGLLDAFISCWETKYHYDYIRPITVINTSIDKKWEPYLQTPSFPEYTSGHSTVSASAATVLTGLFGDNFAFHDDADKEYIGMERDFPSFLEAAQEASVSRLYGGIHYRLSLDIGNAVGKKVGEHVLQKCN